ncbi:apolipoprotein N-acyltransferase [Flavihumibacter sediminis]|nr:apolipoprotein N-acyltransferase [Flavihumibacter sediminis]
MKKIHPLILSLASGILLAAAWPPLPTTFLIFIAFIPLFMLADQQPRKWAFVGWCALSMMTWNALTTWWIWNSTGPGSIAAIIVNTVLMSIPWLAFYWADKRFGSRYSHWAFIACWMTFEYVHLSWDLSWPWLTLGNVFAAQPSWIQWYEFTGTSGGSLWILLMNVLLFRQLYRTGSLQIINRRAFSITLLSGIGVPILISVLVSTFSQKKDARLVDDARKNNEPLHNVVVVQPNIDPYKKFTVGTQDEQLATLLQLSASQIDSNTRLLVWPETAINLPNGIEEDSIRNNYLLKPLWEFLGNNPKLVLLSGLEGYKIYRSGEQSKYSRPIRDTELWYDSYNSAMLLDSSGILSRYHKSKLVPGVELLPPFLNFLGPLLEQFGGTTGGYARQEERTVLRHAGNGYAIAPAICYESIYGDFMTGFMRNGANIIGIITNDGWWGNTSGHKQHLLYARLRAIENRRWIARSANTGISAFIDPYGRILQQQPWDKAIAIKEVVTLRREMSFFSRNGDLISKFMVAGVLVLILMSLKKKRKKPAL